MLTLNVELSAGARFQSLLGQLELFIGLPQPTKMAGIFRLRICTSGISLAMEDTM